MHAVFSRLYTCIGRRGGDDPSGGPRQRVTRSRLAAGSILWRAAFLQLCLCPRSAASSSRRGSRVLLGQGSPVLMTVRGLTQGEGRTPPAAASLDSEQPPRRRGAFVVLEGIDRCGKSTQIERLVQSLQTQGVRCEAIRFPDRTTRIGKMINDYLANGENLSDHAIHLLFSANRWEAEESLRSKLASGVTLICDRYAFSGVAFSAAKETLDIDWCKECDRGLPAPDAVIYLDISVEEAAKRGRYGEERYETREMQTRVRENFMKLMKGDDTWHVVDACLSVDEVSRLIADAALKTVKEAEHRPLGTLWRGSTICQ